MIKEEINFDKLEKIVGNISDFIMHTNLTKEQRNNLDEAIDLILSLEDDYRYDRYEG